MTLEQQLEALSALGLSLNPGISIDDLLQRMPRSDYEERPFDAILFVLGDEVDSEPRGRSFCSRVWFFDTECIYSTGDYKNIVERLCEVAGHAKTHFSNLDDHVDSDDEEAWLSYTKPDGTVRHWSAEFADDWADMVVVSEVMTDLETQEARFYVKNSGQAMLVFFLSEDAAQELGRLSGGALSRVKAE